MQRVRSRKKMLKMVCELIFPLNARLARLAQPWHPACTHGAHSAVTVAPAEVVPSGPQRYAGACAIARQLRAARRLL